MIDEKQNRKILQNLRAVERKKRAAQLRKQKGAPTPEVEIHSGDTSGVIAAVHGALCTVWLRDEELRCRPLPRLAVGDRVSVSRERRAVTGVEPRRTVLSRADPHNSNLERVLAANVDVAVIVVSLRSPELRPGLIDRILIAIERGGAEPVICANKIDLIASTAELKALDVYREIGIPLVPCSATTGAGIELLSGLIAGRTCVFLGHSGVGKSSLVNALDPHADAATGSISGSTGKGRHTTSASSLRALSNGALVIDTPGVREFGLWDVDREALLRHFHEFADYACRFPSCTHRDEPDCAVRKAADCGDIAPERYRTYLRLHL